MNTAILLLLIIFFYFYAKKFFAQRLARFQKNLQIIQNGCRGILKENAQIEQANAFLLAQLNDTIALYEVTKQICKTLDEKSVFSSFSDQINKHIRVSDCRFIKSAGELAKFPDYTILPLEINTQPAGYLVVKGIKEEEREKFQILAQQFILGIKRTLLYQKVQELAIMDSLTGIFSRRYYLERSKEELVRSQKFKYKFSFLMLDVDNFKYYNDHYGHLVGDAVLKEVTRTIRERVRQIDLVGKFGGDEFSLILIETDKSAAQVAAERIRQAIAGKTVKLYDENLQVTASIGISVFPEDAKDIPALIEAADQALYKAKAAGKNRVCVS